MSALISPAPRRQGETQLADLPFPLRRALALAAHLKRGALTVTLPDGDRMVFHGREAGPDAALTIHHRRFARRVLLDGALGFAEAYRQGEWTTPDLAGLLFLLATNRDLLVPHLPDRPLRRLWRLLRHAARRNTQAGSRRNIAAHYDLGNSFFAAWLDRTMTYSAAVFAPGEDDLERAQHRKYRLMAEEASLGPEHHVLEIGCGWGGFALFAAREVGCRVTALTLSEEQFRHAARLVYEAGLAGRVTVKLLDYREETGTYDRIVSIEMMEAVGETYWPVFFRVLKDRLREQGRAALQVITIRDENADRYRREIDFIRQSVFPGGMLPSSSVLHDLRARSGLSLVSEQAFGADYAKTLAHWRRRFRAAWPDLAPLGFDERFRRMWEYYLAYCEAGFRADTVDVRRIVFARL